MLLEKYDIVFCSEWKFLFIWTWKKNRLIESCRCGSHWPVTFCELGKIPEISTSFSNFTGNFTEISKIHTIDSNFLTTKFSGDESPVCLLFSFKLEEFLRMWRRWCLPFSFLCIPPAYRRDLQNVSGLCCRTLWAGWQHLAFLHPHAQLTNHDEPPAPTQVLPTSNVAPVALFRNSFSTIIDRKNVPPPATT